MKYIYKGDLVIVESDLQISITPLTQRPHNTNERENRNWFTAGERVVEGALHVFNVNPKFHKPEQM